MTEYQLSLLKELLPLPMPDLSDVQLRACANIVHDLAQELAQECANRSLHGLPWSVRPW